MGLPSISEQKPDVYDVIMGGDDAYDPATTPLFNTIPNGPDSDDAKKFQFVFDVPTTPSNTGSVAGGQWSQAGVTGFGDPSRLYGRMHHKKYLIGSDEVTEGDKGYAMQGLTRFQYDTRRTMRQLVCDCELVMIGPQENHAGSTVETYVTRGLELYILPTSLIGLQTDAETQIVEAFRPSAAQVKEVTAGTGDYTYAETDLQAQMAAAYGTRRAKIKWKGWLTPRLKQKISDFGNLQPVSNGFAAVRRFNQDASSLKMITTFQKFIGDCGEVELDLHPYLRLNTDTQKAEGLFLEDGFALKRVRRKPMVKPMPEDAGVQRGYGMATMGLQVIPIFMAQVRRAAA